MIDLHTHSNASDGALSPADLVRHASREGLKALALTDHDTVGGIAEAAAEAELKGIAFVAGVEIEIEFDPGEFHLLGLGVDADDAHVGFLAKGAIRVEYGDAGGFSDFFRTIFGGMGNFEEARTGHRGARRQARGEDTEAEIEVSLEEAARGGSRHVAFETPSGRRDYDVTIPKGVAEGTRIRLSGQGSPGRAGGRRPLRTGAKAFCSGRWNGSVMALAPNMVQTDHIWL